MSCVEIFDGNKLEPRNYIKLNFLFDSPESSAGDCDMALKMLLLYLSLFTYLSVFDAYKYVVSINDDLGPCDNGKPYIDKYADMSNILLTKKDDDVLVVEGNMTTLIDFPPLSRFVVQLSYYRKERGDWVLLPMKQIYPDFCAVLFSPLELWHPVARQLKGDARKCPPPKGVRTSI